MKTVYMVQSKTSPGYYWCAGSWVLGSGHIYTTPAAAGRSALVKRGAGEVVAVLVADDAVQSARVLAA